MPYTNVTGTNGNNILLFQGIVGFYNTTLINPYSGFTITVSGTKNVNNAIYDGLGGSDTISMTSLGDVLTLADADGTIMVRNVENFNAGFDGDIIILAHQTLSYGNVVMRGSDGDDLLWSNDGNDTIQAGAGNDIVDGGRGNDIVYGAEGNDYLSGGEGTDTLLGGEGDDTLVYNADGVWSADYTLASLGSGMPLADQINLDGMNRSYDTFNGDADDFLTVPTPGVDTLVMTEGNDVIVVNDIISPISGVYSPRVTFIDVFNAGGGNDIVDLSGGIHVSTTIHGGSGDDILGGSVDNDTINGDDGNDRLFGAGGNDILSGGTGDDTYFYNLGDGSDTITETSGIDSLVFGTGITLSNLGFEIDGLNLKIMAGGDIITIQNHFATDLSGLIESLVFADNSSYDIAFYGPPAAPVANDDIVAGDEDILVTGNVLNNDTDPNNDPLTVTPQNFTTSLGGTVILSADGSFSYQGALNFHGVDSFTYTIHDTLGMTSTASVLLTIDSINDAPLAHPDFFDVFRNSSVSGNVLSDNGGGADFDADGDLLSVLAQAITTAQGGTVLLNTDGSFTYTPPTGFFGNDSFDYTLDDGHGGQDVATVSLNVELDPSHSIIGTNADESINGTTASDEIFGLDGHDTIKGQDGDDAVYGGSGDDILYGDDGVLTGTTWDKTFADTIIIPELMERVNIANLRPPGTPALGIADGNLNVSQDGTATITFRTGYAGYNSSFGSYAIAADGTIQNATMHWKNVKTAGFDIAHQIDLPTGPGGGDFGFFIIANGDNANNHYNGLSNITGEGNIDFIYHYGLSDARAAKITDNGAQVSVVYNDGVTARVLNGHAFFTTDRGDTPSINRDGKVHAVSGLLDNNNISLNIKTSDLAGNHASITKNGITITASQGNLTSGGDKVGISSSQAGGAIISGNEKLHIGFATGADKVILSLSDIAGGSTGLDLKIYLNGDTENPVLYEYAVGSSAVGGKLDFALNATSFGTGVITGVEISSVSNSALGTETFYLDNVRAEIPGGTNTNAIRIGFEDLTNTGDADYEDVLFDLDINAQSVGDIQGGNDVLDGGAGNDSLYGEGGDDILFVGLGLDHAHGGEGADIFALKTIDSLVDQIHDFNIAQGDSINIFDVLENYDPLNDAISDFVHLAQVGSDTHIQINADGTGTDFVTAAIVLGGLNGTTLTDLVSQGAIVADHGV